MKINVLGISGSPIKGGNTEVLLQKALKEVEAEDANVEFVSLAKKKIGDCIHCNWCARNQTEEKLCALKDDMDDIYPKLLSADAVILASPVHIGRLSGLMANMLDRCRVAIHGKVYRHAFKNKVGAGIAVGWYRHGGIETTLLSLHYAFFILDMVPVSPGISSVYGAGGLTSYQGEGFCEKDDKLPVLRDEYGFETSKATVQRAIEVARLIKAGGIYLGNKE